jgi:hypothetical protein
MYEIRISSITRAFLLKELGYPQGCDRYISICTKNVREERFLELLGDVDSYLMQSRSDGKHDDFAQPLSVAVLEFLINKFDGSIKIDLATIEFQLNELSLCVVRERGKHQIDQSISFIVDDMLDLMIKKCSVSIYPNSEEGTVMYSCDLSNLK